MSTVDELILEGNELVNKYKKQKNTETYAHLGGRNYESWMGKVAIYTDNLPDGIIKNELRGLYRKRNNYLEAIGAEKVLGALTALANEKITEREENKKLKIFISHSSKDKKYGDALLGLLTGLGLKRDEIIYTSNDLYGIPLGKKIYEYLRNNIDTNVHMIFLLSNNYFESIACLNEMGAAWLAQKEYTVIGVPGFDFNFKAFNECCIDSKEMGLTMENMIRITEFKGIIENEFGKRIDDMEWQDVLEKYRLTVTSVDA
jgi:hypothetical protein